MIAVQLIYTVNNSAMLINNKKIAHAQNLVCYKPGVDPHRLLRLLEDGQKSKYSIRTVKLLQLTPIVQSNI